MGISSKGFGGRPYEITELEVDFDTVVMIGRAFTVEDKTLAFPVCSDHRSSARKFPNVDP